MKLEVGMYVRTTDGLLALLTELYNENSVIVKWQYDEKRRRESFSQSISKDYIKKASHNIIDLIEVGDYVNGHLVTATYNPNGDEMYHISLQNGKDYILIHNDDEIKSILTHEQYEANCYKVAE